MLEISSCLTNEQNVKIGNSKWKGGGVATKTKLSKGSMKLNWNIRMGGWYGYFLEEHNCQNLW